MLFGALVGGVLQQLKFRRERGSAGMTRTGKRKMPEIGGRSSILVRLAVAKPDTQVSGARFPYTGIDKDGIVAVFVLTGGIAARNGSRTRLPCGTVPL